MSDGPVVVWGAGGGTGKAVVARLLSEGKRVRAVVRNPASVEEQAAGPFKHEKCEVVQGDVESVASCKEHTKEARAVVFAASGRGYLDTYAVDFQGVANCATAAAEAKIERFVLISSAFVSPHRFWHPVRLLLNTFKWRVMDNKFEGEEALRRSGVPYTIIRPGRLADATTGQAQWLVTQGDASEGGGSIARADVAAVAVAALSRSEAACTTFEIFGRKGPSEPKQTAVAEMEFFTGLAKDAAGKVAAS